MEILLLSGHTLGYLWDMIKIIMVKLMIWKLWKELKDKSPLFLLMLTKLKHQTILLIGLEEKKFSTLTLKNFTDFSDTDKSSST